VVIVGVGVDVMPVARFAAAVARSPGLVERVFAAGERGLPVASLAARFAAKAAVAKAVGAPGGLRWRDVEVVRDGAGRPELRVVGSVADAATARGVARWKVTLSHGGGMAMALVVGESA
jgi:holo-[acyl-carrier protein] synthase